MPFSCLPKDNQVVGSARTEVLGARSEERSRDILSRGFLHSSGRNYTTLRKFYAASSTVGSSALPLLLPTS